MRIYKHSVKDLPSAVLLGKQTESGVTEVRIDCAPWLTQWPGINISLWPTPPGGAAAYPAATRMEGTELVWLVSGADTATAGSGRVEIMGIADGVKKLSVTGVTRILGTTTATTSEPPEAAQPWVNDVLDAAARAEAAAERAENATPGGSDSPGAPGADGESAYEIAVRHGFEGTEEEWLASLDGDSITITSVLQDESDGGYNEVTFSDGTVLLVKNGERGKTGPVGPRGEPGLNGIDGLDGQDGKDGKDYEEVPAEQFGIPVLSLTGDISGMNKDNAVTLSYVYGERTGTLTCKWQGSSSLAFPKKNYTIKFDTAFEAKEGWGVHEKYCLKANWVDASNVRNLFGAGLWGRIVKRRDGVDARLKVLPNGGAVDGFPVWLRINGEDVGMYTWNIPKDAWMFGMTGANAAEAILCAENFNMKKSAACNGADMEIEYTAAADTSATVASFNAMVSALNGVQSASDLGAVEALLDINSVIDYYMLTCVLCHHDGVYKNYIMATYDGTKWFMSAYDMDGTCGNKALGEGLLAANDWPSFSDVAVSNKLFWLIETYYKDRLKTRFTNLTYGVLGEISLQHAAYTLAYDMPAELIARDNRLWPTRPGTNTHNYVQIIEWLRLRLAQMKTNINSW